MTNDHWRARSAWSFVLGHLLCIGISSLGICLPGCQYAGVVAHIIGPPAVEPLYVPAQTPMLVLAENYANPSAGQDAAEQLERFVIDELVAHGVAPMADYERVYDLRASHPREFRAKSIDQLGQLAGAAQVLYINLQLDTSDVGQGSDVFQGRGSAVVRIVDAETGQTLWPEEGSDGYPVGQQSQYERARPGVNSESVRRGVQKSIADQIGKLFYKYKPDE
jgi:hypothetical protein